MQSNAHARDLRRFTILVADSDFYFDAFLGQFLRDQEHVIFRANSAANTLALTRLHGPDLILLDDDLDGADGIDLMTELLLEHSSSAVIVMAAHPSVSDAVEAMKLGAADYLERPLDPERLKRAIDLQKTLFLLP